MVKGIGTDIIDIDRIKAVVVRHGERFLKKVFAPAEIELCGSRPDSGIHFAGRWAAKEAFYKALPLSCQPVSSWKSIQIVSRDGSGRPEIEICRAELKTCLSEGGIENIHLSISHERSFCVAFVVLE